MTQEPITKGNAMANKNHAKAALVKFNAASLTAEQKMQVIKKASAQLAGKK